MTRPHLSPPFQALLNRCLVFFLSTTAYSLAETHIEKREALGTTLELKVVSASKNSAVAAYQSAGGVIERLDKVFNQRRSDSEATKLHKAPKGKSIKLSKDMAVVLDLAVKGNKLSRGKYSIFSQHLTEVWKQAEKSQSLPTPDAIKKACRDIALADKHLQKNLKGQRLNEPLLLPVDFDSLAKGYIIDHCLAAMMKRSGVKAALVNIGGDIAVTGTGHVWEINIQNKSGTDSVQPLRITRGAIATSGNQYRYYTIKGKKYSHLLDASTGQPAAKAFSVSVSAGESVFADMLATITNLGTPTEAISMMNRLKQCSCLVLDNHGRQKASKRWMEKGGGVTLASGGIAKVGRSAGEKKIQIAWTQKYAPKTSQKHRHFTVVWVENEDGEKVRDLVLWYKGKKSKYLRKFKSWWGLGGAETISNSDVLKNISSASKKKGQYDVVWDHKNQLGEPLPPGVYYIHIEVNREKGPNKERPSSCKVKIDTRKSNIKETGKEQPELESITIQSI